MRESTTLSMAPSSGACASPTQNCHVALDREGYVIVTGYFGGTIDFGTGVLTSAFPDDEYLSYDIFLAKLHGP